MDSKVNITTTVELKDQEEPITWETAVCGNCPCFEPFPWDEKCDPTCEKAHPSERGLCRINPPEIGPDGIRGVWPVTNVDDWCVPGRDFMMELLHSQGVDEQTKKG